MTERTLHQSQESDWGGRWRGTTVLLVLLAVSTTGPIVRGDKSSPGQETSSGAVSLTPQKPVVLKDGSQPVFLRVADLNQDGILDLVVVSHARHQVSIHLGIGDGQLLQPVVYSSQGREPRSVEVADFDEDGILDLAVGNHGSSTVAILTGHGDGTFASLTEPCEVGEHPRMVQSANLDQDGHLDLVTANMSGGNVTVLRGDGRGGFGPPRHMEVTPPQSIRCTPRFLTLEDFNRDGHIDAAVACSHGANLVLMDGDGRGGFGTPRGLVWNPEKSYSLHVLPLDANGDGHRDLVVVNYYGASLTVLLADGAGGFRDPTSVSLGEPGFEPRFTASADFDEDGHPDLLVADAVRNRVGVLLGEGDGTFRLDTTMRLLSEEQQAAFDKQGSSYPHLNASVVVGDLNDDGRPDAVAVRDFDSLAVLLNGDQVLLQPQATVTPSVPSTERPGTRTPKRGHVFYVAPDGTSDGQGTRESPWDLQGTLADPDRTRPGDTIHLLGGTYRGGVICRLSGTSSAPITIAGQPGEQAVIDTYDQDPHTDPAFAVSGSYLTFRNFTLTNSDPAPRMSSTPGAAREAPRGRIVCRGAHNEFVNLVIHDLDAGVNFWADGAGGTIYGCLIYNIGWIGPDRPHGHGIYVQNQHGLKTLAENIIFQTFATGIHAYGSEKAYLRGLRLEGNIIFSTDYVPGEVSAGSRAILVGGGSPASDIGLHENYTYGADSNGVTDLGYTWGPVNGSLDARGNYLVGTVRFHQGWRDVRWVENTLVSGSQPAIHLKTPDGTLPGDYDWNRNRYFTTAKPLLLDGELLGLGEWQLRGCDVVVASAQQLPTENEVFVRVNRYAPQRAHVVIYNWQDAAEVDVDLSALLQQGHRFAVRHVAFLDGPPLVTGTWSGQPTRFPMRRTVLPVPSGFSGQAPAVLGRKFGVFVVERQ